MVTAWIDLFLGWTREDWLCAKSHFQLADVLESTEQPVGATQIMGGPEISLWGKETVSAGSQMWSWAQAASLCLLVITVELCHARDFISSWYFGMKNVWVFEHSRKSEPPSQGVFTQSSKPFTSSDILIYLGTWIPSQAVSPFLSSVLLKEAGVQPCWGIPEPLRGGLDKENEDISWECPPRFL